MLFAMFRDGVITTLSSVLERNPALGYPIGGAGFALGAISKLQLKEWINDYMLIGGAILLTLTIIAQGRNAFRRAKERDDKQDG